MTAVVGPRSVWKNLVGYYVASDSRSYPGSGNTWYDLSAKNNDLAATSGVSFSSGEITIAGSGVFQSSAAINDIKQSDELTIVVVAKLYGDTTQKSNIFSPDDGEISFNYGELDPPPIDSFATKEVTNTNFTITASVTDNSVIASASTGATKNVTANNYTVTSSVTDNSVVASASTGTTKNVTTNNYAPTIAVTDNATVASASTGATKNAIANNLVVNNSHTKVDYYRNGLFMTLNSTISKDIPSFVNYELDIIQNKSNVDTPANPTTEQFYCMTLSRYSTTNTYYVNGYTNTFDGRLDYFRNLYIGQPDNIQLFPGSTLKFGNGVAGGPSTGFRMIAIFDRELTKDEVNDLFHSIRGKYSL